MLNQTRSLAMPAASAQPSGRTRLVFLRRVRKAGSTSLADYLLNVKRVYDSGVAHSPGASLTLRLEEVEYDALNVNCFIGQGAGWLKTRGAFLVTHLRSPLSRINSEYWFSGPGSKHHAANDSLWKTWIEETKPGRDGSILKFRGTARAKFYAGTYYDNYYVRILSKICGECTSRTDIIRTTNAVDGCSANELEYPYQFSLQRSDLENAKTVLDKFDVVLISEWFNQPVLKTLLVRRLEAALEIAPRSILARRLESLLPLGVKRATKTNVLPGHGAEHRLAPPQGISDFLKVDNALDFDLYAYAKKRSATDLRPYREAEMACTPKHTTGWIGI